MTHRISFIAGTLMLLAVLTLTGFELRSTHAQNTPNTASSGPEDMVDQIMSLVGHGRIDEAIGIMQGLKNEPDARDEARARLTRLAQDQGAYHGYEVVAIQRYSSQFQTFDAVAYYDEQPVLFRFRLYRPQIADNVKWTVLGFEVTAAMPEIAEALKDTPVDYVARKTK